MFFSVFRPLPTILGTLLVVLTFVDLVSTAVSVSSGAGPVTRRISQTMWRLALWVQHRTGSRGVLRRAGPTILFTVIAAWTGLLIVGWSLVFGQPETIVRLDDGEFDTFLGRLYFASATILGVGGDRTAPSTDLWQFVEQIAAASGVGLLGLSIAYVVPVVNAVVFKREVANYVHALGNDASDVLRRCWNGTDFGDLDLHLIALTPRIAGLAERHLAYPVVHYFHSGARSTALGPAIVTLDEILTLNEHAIEEEHRMGPSVVEPLRTAITTFLDTLEAAFIGASEADIAEPKLDDLRDSGVPIVDGDQTPGDRDHVQERRRLLRGYLEEDGWSDAGLLPRTDDPDAAPVPGQDGRG